jgi:hypothetical protein
MDISQAQVEECQIMGLLRQRSQGVFSGGCSGDMTIRFFKAKGKRCADVFLIVDDEHLKFLL